MDKEVIVSVSGIQYALDEDMPVEIISSGECYHKNGKTYVMYDEVLNERISAAEIIKSTIKVGEKQIELIKRGPSNTHMIFEKGKNHIACYNTPLGNLIIGVMTKDISVLKEKECMKIQIEYSLDINYSHVSDCNIIIKVVSKDKSKAYF